LLLDNNSTVHSTYEQRVKTPCKAELDVGVLQQRFHQSMRHSTPMLPSQQATNQAKSTRFTQIITTDHPVRTTFSAFSKPTQRRSTPVPDHDCALRLQRRLVGVHQQLQQERLRLAQNLRGA
jgi:hypothetical protein